MSETNPEIILADGVERVETTKQHNSGLTLTSDLSNANIPDHYEFRWKFLPASKVLGKDEFETVNDGEMTLDRNTSATLTINQITESQEGWYKHIAFSTDVGSVERYESNVVYVEVVDNAEPVLGEPTLAWEDDGSFSISATTNRSDVRYRFSFYKAGDDTTKPATTFYQNSDARESDNTSTNNKFNLPWVLDRVDSEFLTTSELTTVKAEIMCSFKKGKPRLIKEVLVTRDQILQHLPPLPVINEIRVVYNNSLDGRPGVEFRLDIDHKPEVAYGWFRVISRHDIDSLSDDTFDQSAYQSMAGSLENGFHVGYDAIDRNNTLEGFLSPSPHCAVEFVFSCDNPRNLDTPIFKRKVVPFKEFKKEILNAYATQNRVHLYLAENRQQDHLNVVAKIDWPDSGLGVAFNLNATSSDDYDFVLGDFFANVNYNGTPIDLSSTSLPSSLSHLDVNVEHELSFTPVDVVLNRPTAPSISSMVLTPVNTEHDLSPEKFRIAGALAEMPSGDNFELVFVNGDDKNSVAYRLTYPCNDYSNIQREVATSDTNITTDTIKAYVKIDDLNDGPLFDVTMADTSHELVYTDAPTNCIVSITDRNIVFTGSYGSLQYDGELKLHLGDDSFSFYMTTFGYGGTTFNIELPHNHMVSGTRLIDCDLSTVKIYLKEQRKEQSPAATFRVVDNRTPPFIVVNPVDVTAMPVAEYEGDAPTKWIIRGTFSPASEIARPDAKYEVVVLNRGARSEFVNGSDTVVLAHLPLSQNESNSFELELPASALPNGNPQQNTSAVITRIVDRNIASAEVDVTEVPQDPAPPKRKVDEPNHVDEVPPPPPSEGTGASDSETGVDTPSTTDEVPPPPPPSPQPGHDVNEGDNSVTDPTGTTDQPPVSPSETEPTTDTSVPPAETPTETTPVVHKVEILGDTNIGAFTEGDYINLNANVTPEGTSLQWYVDKGNGVLVAIPNATTASFHWIPTIDDLNAERTGFKAFLRSVHEGSHVDSNPLEAQQFISRNLTLTARSHNNLTLTEGEQAAFEVQADPNDAHVTYQWYRRSTEGQITEITTANESVLTINPLQLADAGIYYCVARRLDKSARSEEMTLVVNKQEVPIEFEINLPQEIVNNDYTLEVHQNRTVTVTATVVNATNETQYQWYSQRTGATPVEVGGQNTPTLNLGVVTPEFNANYFLEVRQGRSFKRGLAFRLNVVNIPDVIDSNNGSTGADGDIIADPTTRQLLDRKHLTVRGIARSINQYCTAMAEGVPVTPIKGAEHQKNLYREFRTALRLKEHDVWLEAMDAIVDFFVVYKEQVFRPQLRARFISQMNAFLSPNDIEAFQELLELFADMADPERALPRNLAETADVLESPHIYARFSQYYNMKLKLRHPNTLERDGSL